MACATETANENTITEIIKEVKNGEIGFQKHIIGEPIEKEDNSIKDRVNKYCKKFSPLDVVIGFFPILSWLPKYKIKKWLPGDILSGITVGVVHIPQSMSFSLLAGLPPVFGLYTTFWTVLFYIFTGTSRHLSVGTFAVISLLTQPVVYRYFPDPVQQDLPPTTDNYTTTTQTEMMTTTVEGGFPEIGVDEFFANRVAVASALMMLMGIFQFVFGVFRLGMITTYMSEPLVQGFTTGAAMHVALSQMPLMLGLKPKAQYGFGSFYLGCIYIFRNIPNIHVPTLIITIISLIFLVICREINIRYKNRMKVPIPAEVILVVISILASHFGMFANKYQVPVVGPIPQGFPSPRLPNTSILGDIIGDAIGIAIVGFALNIGVSRFYSIKYNYPIDANQELLAYGVTNFVPSFFLCFPNAAALARCQILDQSGGKTQIVGVVTVIILLVTILVLGPVFENMPKGVLGCIIFTGLIGIFEQFHLIKPTWKVSKPDCLVWVFTFLAVCSLGVDFGLYTAIGFALFVSIVRTQTASSEVLGNVKGTDIYRNSDIYVTTKTFPGMVIFKFNSILYYVTRDNFKRSLFKAIGFVPGDVLKERVKAEKKKKAEEKREAKKNSKKDAEYVSVDVGNGTKSRNLSEEENDEIEDELSDLPDMKPDATSGSDVGISTLVLDCTAFSMIDFVGIKTLKTLYVDLHNLGVNMYLTNISNNVREYLKSGGFYEIAGKECEFLTVHDAVLFVQKPAMHRKLSVRRTISESEHPRLRRMSLY